jgi:hypothetical protein
VNALKDVKSLKRSFALCKISLEMPLLTTTSPRLSGAINTWTKWERWFSRNTIKLVHTSLIMWKSMPNIQRRSLLSFNRKTLVLLIREVIRVKSQSSYWRLRPRTLNLVYMAVYQVKIRLISTLISVLCTWKFLDSMLTSKSLLEQCGLALTMSLERTTTLISLWYEHFNFILNSFRVELLISDCSNTQKVPDKQWVSLKLNYHHYFYRMDNEKHLLSKW